MLTATFGGFSRPIASPFWVPLEGIPHRLRRRRPQILRNSSVRAVGTHECIFSTCTAVADQRVFVAST